MSERRKKQSYFDYSLVAVVVFLTCFGLVMLYSASAYSAQQKFNDGMYFFSKQAAISFASLVIMFVVSRLDYHFIGRFSVVAYVGSIFMILLVLTPLAIDSHGAKRWIKIAGLQMQPAELSKVAIILFIPFVICKMGRKFKTLKGTLIVCAYGAVVSAMIFKITDNLSSAIIIFGITIILVFLVHPKTLPFVAIGGVGMAAIVGVVMYLQTHISEIAEAGSFRIERILVWLEPEKYAGDQGFQTLQALYAIGSGGIFGKGLGNSTQKLSSLPEAQNDMIFSVICEELGLCGAIMVTMLFVLMLYRLYIIAKNAPDLYGSLMVAGIFAHISLQVLFNIAVVTGVIPTTGITLPFISYGGTSIVFLMIEMGLALSVSNQIKYNVED